MSRPPEPLVAMLTAREVAQLLHVHINTVKRWGDRGELPFYRIGSRGDRRYDWATVQAFLRRGQNGG